MAKSPLLAVALLLPIGGWCRPKPSLLTGVVETIPSGTTIVLRTNEAIAAKVDSDRSYSAVVVSDVKTQRAR
jgi:hypothetical protein